MVGCLGAGLRRRGKLKAVECSGAEEKPVEYTVNADFRLIAQPLDTPYLTAGGDSVVEDLSTGGDAANDRVEQLLSP